jgi:hypothetical protein
MIFPIKITHPSHCSYSNTILLVALHFVTLDFTSSHKKFAEIQEFPNMADSYKHSNTHVKKLEATS